MAYGEKNLQRKDYQRERRIKKFKDLEIDRNNKKKNEKQWSWINIRNSKKTQEKVEG